MINSEQSSPSSSSESGSWIERGRLLRSVLAARERVARLELRASAPDYFTGLSSAQYAFATDPALLSGALCGRRAGKTTVDARIFLDALERYPVMGPQDEFISALYVAPTRGQAKRLMWGRLQALARYFKVDLRFNSTDLIVTHPNGAQGWILGSDDDRDMDRMRGFAFRDVTLDEVQAFRIAFQELVEDVLEPALSDYGGKLRLTGTPSPACIGYFHDATNGLLPGDWSVHRWTLLDNPNYPRWRGDPDWERKALAFLEAYRARKGWGSDHPTYMREWRGLWVRDASGLVYKYDPTINSYDGELPAGFHWEHVFGIDLGRVDAFSLVVWAVCEDRPDVYEVDCYRKSGLSMEEWARVIQAKMEEYRPLSMAVDTGGLGGTIVDDMRKRFSLPLKPAEKKEKFSAIEVMNSDFHSKLIWIRRSSPLHRSYQVLPWDEDRKKEDPRWPNDDTDAALYGFRESKHWTYQALEPRPAEGSAAHYKAIEAKMKASLAGKGKRAWYQ